MIMEEVLGNEQRMSSMPKQVVPQMSVGQWVITLLILFIPLVNIIMMIIWALDPMSARQNFARAYIIIYAIGLVISIVFMILVFMLSGAVGSFMDI